MSDSSAVFVASANHTSFLSLCFFIFKMGVQSNGRIARVNEISPEVCLL